MMNADHHHRLRTWPKAVLAVHLFADILGGGGGGGSKKGCCSAGVSGHA